LLAEASIDCCKVLGRIAGKLKNREGPPPSQVGQNEAQAFSIAGKIRRLRQRRSNSRHRALLSFVDSAAQGRLANFVTFGANAASAVPATAILKL
jgi:hypothetical protein